MDKGKGPAENMGTVGIFPQPPFSVKKHLKVLFSGKIPFRRNNSLSECAFAPFFENILFDITGPNQIYKNSTGPVLKVCKVGSLMRQEKLSVC